MIDPPSSASSAANSASASMDGSAGGGELRRVVGLPLAVGIVLGDVIGSGIFAKPGLVAQQLGSLPMILLAWLLVGVVALLGALSLAELGAMMPRAGGLYLYLRSAYGPWAGFLFGWMELLFNKPASTGALAVFVVAQILGQPLTAEQTFRHALLAASLILILALVNVRGVLWGARTQFLFVIVKAGCLACFLLLLSLLPFGWFPFSTTNWGTVAPVAEGSFVSRFSIVLLSVLWAYNGWHNLTPVAEEIRDPERNIPRALIIGVGMIVCLYIGANLLYHAVLPMEVVASSGTLVANRAIETLFGPSAALVLLFVTVGSATSAINSDMLVSPRISFALGRDGLSLDRLGSIHPRYGTPAAAILTQAALSCAMVLSVTCLVLMAPGWAGRTSLFDVLTDFCIFASSIFYALAVLAVVILRWKEPDRPRPYRTWGYPWVPLLFVSFYIWLLSQLVFSRPFESRASLALIGVGLVVYFVRRRWSR